MKQSLVVMCLIALMACKPRAKELNSSYFCFTPMGVINLRNNPDLGVKVHTEGSSLVAENDSQIISIPLTSCISLVQK